MRLLVTGGAGFIWSAVIRQVMATLSDAIVSVDRLTYADNLESLAKLADDPQYAFEQVDICSRNELNRVFATHRSDAVMNLAVESHVDRSISGPAAFIEANVVGTYTIAWPDVGGVRLSEKDAKAGGFSAAPKF